MGRTVRLAIPLLFVLPFFGQDFRGTVTGQVKDTTNGVIPDALVKAVHQDTRNASETRTNSHGYYTLPYLLPGRYLIEVSAPGLAAIACARWRSTR